MLAARPARAPRRAAMAFIFVTVLLDMVALGMVVPVLPSLLREMLHADTARAAALNGHFVAVWALVNLLAAPLLGALSDRVGRRPVILLSNFGLALDYVLLAVAPTVAWLWVGRVLSGLTTASVPAANAYIADTTAPEGRARAFGMLGAAFGVGFVLGPALGGVLGREHLRLPFALAAGLSLLNGLYGLFVLPESLPKEQRAAFSWRKANPFGALALYRAHADLAALAAARFLGHLAHMAWPSVFVLYASARHGWDERDVGLNLAAIGLLSGVVQAGLVGPVEKRLGERGTILLGVAFGVLAFVWSALAPTGAWFWWTVVPSALWGLTGPSLEGRMSRRVGPTEQGRLQGANTAVTGLAEVLGPHCYTPVFALTLRAAGARLHPGAPFFVAAVILALSWGVLAWSTREVEPSRA